MHIIVDAVIQPVLPLLCLLVHSGRRNAEEKYLGEPFALPAQTLAINHVQYLADIGIKDSHLSINLLIPLTPNLVDDSLTELLETGNVLELRLNKCLCGCVAADEGCGCYISAW